MTSFDTRYSKLNDHQKAAVNKIDGPLMVIAGPGTGKTELLAMRVANILRKDSTLLPTNILCLTFTEAGQVAMQRRLVEYMGEAGAHVAVHTFHSFGAEIINSHPEYFFNNTQYSAAEELSTHEVLIDVLDKLPTHSPLAAKHEGEYALIGAIKSRIGQLKKAAVTPEELAALVQDGLAFVDYVEPQIIEVFGATFTKKQLPAVGKLLEHVEQYSQPTLDIAGFKPLSEVCAETLALAHAEALADDTTKPITIWKKAWFARDADKQPVCKQRAVLEKLTELARVYDQYQQELGKRRLYDFDDMIMRVVHALESRGDLAFDLQEQYQYFLVDEFQDTNAGQMRLLQALASHEVNEGKPNVMVVGDDDQAIFAFQGAELSNILGFADTYPTTERVTLTENYRSTADILATSRAIITQGIDRLENHRADIDKTLHANKAFKVEQLSRQTFALQAHELEWVAADIARQLASGVVASDIAVIAREHRQLEKLLPYLFAQQVPVSYERRENALDNPHIKELLVLAQAVNYLAHNHPYEANGLLPELLSADYWQLPAIDIWQLSLASRRVTSEFEADKLWLNVMLEGSGRLKSIAGFLIEAAKFASTHGLDETLDVLIGNTDPPLADDSTEDSDQPATSPAPASPFKAYYFSDQALHDNPESYIDLLAALTAVRNAARAYRPDESHNLASLLEFCELSRRAKVNISVRGIHATRGVAVQLLTAHKSKGLEFDTVYMVSATQATWDAKQRGGGISFSPNMLSIAHGSNPDDNLRLFYVAMTRAKRQLFMSSYQLSDSGKQMLDYAPLEDTAVQAVLAAPNEATAMADDTLSRLARAERSWHDKHLSQPADIASLLQERLENYALSATHLNNFLDVTNGGPQMYFLHNLLQFPSAMSPSAAYGSAMHSTLEYLHTAVIHSDALPDIAEAEDFFVKTLERKGLLATDTKRYGGQGKRALQAIYSQRSELFDAKQLPEQDFRRQGVSVGPARLTGKLDLLSLDKNQAVVTDYKTGKPLKAWTAPGMSAYEQVKAHKYRQQLLFYKLLVDNSRSWGGRGVRASQGELVFVEPDAKGTIRSLGLELSNDAELEHLRLLVAAIWTHIMELNFPDTSAYSTNLDGIKQFEQDLLDGKI